MRRSLILCVFVLLVGAHPVAAQSNVTVYGQAGMGLVNAPRQFQKFYAAGTKFGGAIGYSFSPQIEVLLRLNYTRFPIDKEGTTQYMVEQNLVGRGSDLQIENTSGTLLSGTANFKFSTLLREQLGFYLIAGVGLYQQSFYGIDVTDSRNRQLRFKAQDQTSPGINFGLGFSVPLTPSLEAFAEPQYVLIFSGELDDPIDPTNAAPLTRTGNVSFFPLRLGLAWSL